jgi:hypothetical protein
LDSQLPYLDPDFCENCGQEPLYCDCEIEKQWSQRKRVTRGKSSPPNTPEEATLVTQKKATQETLLDLRTERDELLDLAKQAVMYWRQPKGGGEFFKALAKRCGLEQPPKPAKPAVSAAATEEPKPAEDAGEEPEEETS